MKIKFTKTTYIILIGIIICAGFTQAKASMPASTNHNNFNALPTGAGSLDTTFDGDGLVTTSFGIGRAFTADAILQTDGKIIVVGTYSWGTSSLALARYNSDGSLDTSFDTDGKVITDFGVAKAVTIQDDGKIIIAGYIFVADQTYSALIRYNADGSLDTTFDNDGKVTTDIGSFAEIVIQPNDGKIVVVGSTNIDINSDGIVVARYNPDGSLDTTFNSDGIFKSSQVSFGNSVIIQSDGKILVNGLIRLNPDGTPDTTFGNNGFVNADGQTALQADGKIIVARTKNDDENMIYSAEISRYNTDGTRDTNFGNNGHTTTAYGDSYNSIQDIAIQTDGKIVLAGHTRVNSTDFNILRYTADGLLDESFSFDGIEYTDFGSQINDDDLANAVVIQPDGNIIVAGYSYVEAGNQQHFALARYIGKLVSVISINRSSAASPTNTPSVDFTVKFSEAVTGVDIGDFSLKISPYISGAMITSITGSGDTYTVSVKTGTGDGYIRLNLIDNDSIQDLIGTKLSGTGIVNGDFTGQRYAIAKNAPFVISMIRANSNPTNSASVQFTVTFSEPVTRVDTSHFGLIRDISDASITSVSGTGASYTVTVNTGTDDGYLQLILYNYPSDAATTILDSENIPLMDNQEHYYAYSGETYTVIKSFPIVTSITRVNPSPTNLSNINFTVTFSNAVTGVNTSAPFSDFALTTTNGISGAAISSVSGSGATYAVTVSTGSGSGTIRLDVLDDDTISFASGDQLGGSGIGNGNFVSGESYAVDKLNPIVLSIKRKNANSNTGIVGFVVTFSKAVTGVDIADFTLYSTDILNASILNVSGSGNIYTVTVNTGSGDGTIRLDFINNGTVIDAVANIMNSNFTGGDVYVIDKPDLARPLLRSPRSRVTTNDSTPVFWWTNVKNAQTYGIEFSTDNSFTNLVHSENNIVTFPYSPPSLIDGVYYWRMRAYNASNQPGAWSLSRAFTIDTAGPSTPTLSFPTNGAAATRAPSFKWSSTSTAVAHEFQYDDDPGFLSPNYTVTVRGTSRRPPAMPNGTYYWHVRAKDTAGNWSDWSAPFTITISR